MVFFNYALRKLNAKIVYYGPGLCGKTTNLQWIHDHFEGGQRGKMISLATEGDRTIFFDLLPIDIGSIRGMDVTLQLYTVPGQVHYNSTRQLVLRGADGVVFVADSQRTMKSSNVESFDNLKENLMLQGIDLKEFPHVLQFNKRDLKDLLNPEELNEDLNTYSVPIFEAVATDGIGVQETLEGIVKLVMRNLRDKYEPMANAGGPQAPTPMRAPTGPAPAAPAAAPPAEIPQSVAPPTEPPPIEPEIQEPPAFESPPEFEPAVEETPVSPQAEPPSFSEEDVIATRVYDDSDGEAFGQSEPVGDEPPDEESGTEIFEEPADEGDTIASKVPSEFDPGQLSDEPDIDTDSGQQSAAFSEAVGQVESPAEAMEDLFDAEPPSLKSYVDDVVNAPDPLRGPADDGDEKPASAVAPPSGDRYEDRIEAPGPFAPPPSTGDEHDVGAAEAAPEQDAVAEPPATPEFEAATEEGVPEVAAPVPPSAAAPSIEDQVLQAFGASENREALASLGSAEPAPTAGASSTEFLEEPPEVKPVVPPPDLADRAESFADFEENEPESEGAPVADTDPGGDAATPAEMTAAEPEVFDEIVAEAPPADAVPDETDEPFAPTDESAAATPPVGGAETPAEIFDKTRPIMVGSGDPFASDEAAATAELMSAETPIAASTQAVGVVGEDNQLHLQLKGSGAIAEMGQVRALDIEVPVPGQWVGNRKVTLQLRLTLTPAEDGDD